MPSQVQQLLANLERLDLPGISAKAKRLADSAGYQPRPVGHSANQRGRDQPARGRQINSSPHRTSPTPLPPPGGPWTVRRHCWRELTVAWTRWPTISPTPYLKHRRPSPTCAGVSRTSPTCSAPIPPSAPTLPRRWSNWVTPAVPLPTSPNSFNAIRTPC